MLTPKASRMSALPHWLENDRLPCLATLTPAPATTNAATVEIVERAGRRHRPFRTYRAPARQLCPSSPSQTSARAARAKPTKFVRSLAFHAQSDQEAGNLRRGGGAAQNQLHHHLRLGGAQILAVHHLVKVGDERHAIVNAWLPCQTSMQFAPTSSGKADIRGSLELIR